MSCIPDFEKCFKILKLSGIQIKFIYCYARSFIILPNRYRNNVIWKIVSSLNIKQSCFFYNCVIHNYINLNIFRYLMSLNHVDLKICKLLFNRYITFLILFFNNDKSTTTLKAGGGGLWMSSPPPLKSCVRPCT